MIPVKLAKTIVLNKFIIYAAIAGGFGTILTVGLLSGLVARPNNCIEQDLSTTQLQNNQTTQFFSTNPTQDPNQTTRTPSSSLGSTSTSSRTSNQPTPSISGSSTISPNTPSTTRIISSTSTTFRPPIDTSSSSSSTTRTTPSTTTTSTRTTSSSSSSSSSTSSRSSSSSSSSTSSRSSSSFSSSSSSSSSATGRTLPSTSTLSTKTTSLSTSFSPVPIRLPENLVEPINYDLLLKTYFNPFYNESDTTPETFEGTVKINFKLNRNSNFFRLHAGSSLEISKETIQLVNEATSQTIPVTLDSLQNQLIQINSATSLAVGSYLLTLNYKGDFGPLTNLAGFYRGRYNEDNVTKTILSTDFEPTDARKAFPCFDEPALKAIFKIAIEHPSDSIALANWPVEKEENIANNRKRTSFKITNKMSTYIVCWVVAPNDYDFVEGNSQKGIPIRIYGRKSAKSNKLLDFALEVAVKATDFFENVYFQISDAIPPKIDMIALPNYPNGAMENWGLITYRETALFFSDDSNSLSNKQSVATIIAHELAHFWFGNLVTPSWWNDLWLNEAMATFLQYKAISTIYTQWDLMDQFTASTLIPVMFDDGFESSQPVYVEVDDPNQISSLFSSITYDKGASLLFMLESTVGSDNFRDGLRNYLTTNKFGSGVADDFYKTLVLPKEMQDAGVTAKQYMESWLFQINYPVVDAILDNDKDPSVSVVDFFQDRFSLSVYNEDFFIPIESPFGYVWKIYLQCYAGGQGDDTFAGSIDSFNFYLGSKNGTLKLNRKYTWVKCNKDFKGYFLTGYSKSNTINLIYALNTKPELFSIGDRANLLHNAFTLAYEGSDNYVDATEFGNYLGTFETEYVPWRVFVWHINKISQIIEHRSSFRSIRAYSYYLTEQVKQRINITTDSGSHTERLLKTTLIEFLCRLQESSCLKYATERFNAIPELYFLSEFYFETNPVSANYRGIVYRYHVQNTNNYDDWFKVNNLYLKTLDPFEKTNSFIALTYSRLAWTLDYLLQELVRDNSTIRSQDFFDILSYIGRNPTGRHQVWAFVREYWYAIVQKFGNSKAFNRAIKNICESFDNTYLLEEVLDLFSTTPDGGGFVQRRQLIDIIVNNIAWVSRETEIIEAFFSGKSQKASRI